MDNLFSASDSSVDSLLNKTKFKRKFKRVCCCCYITKKSIAISGCAAVLSLLIVILCMIFIGGKALAQLQIENSDIVVEMTLSQPETDQFAVHIEGYMDNRGAFGADLDAGDITMLYGDTEIGTVRFPALSIAGGSNTPLDIWSEVSVQDPHGMELLATALLAGPEAAITLKAELGATSFGIHFSSIALEKQVHLQGFDGFNNPPVQVLDMVVSFADGNEIVMAIDAELYNTASLGMQQLGPLSLTMMYGNITLGEAVTANNDISIGFGPNNFKMQARLVRGAHNQEAIDTVFGDYVSGRDVPLMMMGNFNTTHKPVLQPALSHFRAEVVLPGLSHLEDKLIAGAFLKIPNLIKLATQIDFKSCGFVHSLLKIYSESSIHVHNALAIPLQLTYMDVHIAWDGVPEMDIPSMPFAAARTQVDIHVPAASNVFAPVRLCLVYTNQLTAALLKYITQQDTKGNIPFFLSVSMQGTLVGSAAGFPVRLDYNQTSIQVTALAPWGL